MESAPTGKSAKMRGVVRFTAMLLAAALWPATLLAAQIVVQTLRNEPGEEVSKLWMLLFFLCAPLSVGHIGVFFVAASKAVASKVQGRNISRGIAYALMYYVVMLVIILGAYRFDIDDLLNDVCSFCGFFYWLLFVRI